MNRRKGITLVELLVVLSIVVILVSIFASNIQLNLDVSKQDFVRLMTQEGVQYPVVGEYRYGACKEGEYQQTIFAGVKNGQHVEGVICKSWSDTYTIRYF